MKNTFYRLLPLAAGIFLAAGMLFAARPDEGQRRKAEYIFLESVGAFEDERFDDYFMLLRRAHSLDPSDPFIAGRLAEIAFLLPSADSADKEVAYNDLRRRFLADPSNEHYAQIFSNIAIRNERLDDAIMTWSLLDSLQPSRTDPAMNLANVYLARYLRSLDINDYNKALDIYRRLQTGVGHSPALSAPKINAYLLRNDTAAVVDELQAIAADAPADLSSMMFIGAVYEHIDMPDSAMACYNRAAALDTDDGRAYAARAALYLERGDSAAYDRDVFRALEAPGLPFDEKFSMLGGYVKELYTDSLQWPRIERMFGQLLNVNPGEAQLHYYYAGYYAVTDRTAEAAEQLGYSIDLDPANLDRYYSLVQLYFELNDYENVVKTARKGSMLFPDEHRFKYIQAIALAASNDDQGALAVLDSIDLSESTDKALNSSILSTKADIFSRNDMLDSAKACYRMAIEQNAENYMAMNNLAYFNAVDGEDLDISELYASLAVQSDPENTTYLDTYAWVFFKKKDFVRARQEIDKVLRIFKFITDDSNTVREDITIIDQSDSTDIPETADDGSENTGVIISHEVLDHAGDIYFMTGDRDEALRFWKLALQLKPDDEKIKKKVEYKTIFLD